MFFLLLQVSPTFNGKSVDADPLDPAMNEDAQSSYHSSRQGYAFPFGWSLDVFTSFFLLLWLFSYFLLKRVLAPPTFGSSPNFEALTQAYIDHAEDDDSAVNVLPSSRWELFWILFFSVILYLLQCWLLNFKEEYFVVWNRDLMFFRLTWFYYTTMCGDNILCCLSYRPMHEITFSDIDKPKLLSQVGRFIVSSILFC